MQQLDPHTLFSIFEKGDEEVYKEHNITDVLDNPYVLMGMVVRGIENFTLMDMMYMRSYPEQYENVRTLIKDKYFNKLYGYLNRIDSTKFDSIYKIGTSFEISTVTYALNTLLNYFENKEEYEKCGTIKHYIENLTLESAKRIYNFS